MNKIYLIIFFYVLLFKTEVQSQTNLKRAFSASTRDNNGIYTVDGVEETEENILKFAKKNDVVVLAVEYGEETTQYGEVYIPVNSFKYIRPLEYAEIQNQKNIQKQINSERDLANLAIGAAIAYGAYKTIGVGLEYVLKEMCKAGIQLKASGGRISSNQSTKAFNDIERKIYISGNFDCPKYIRTEKECRTENTANLIPPNYEFEVCEFKFKDLDGDEVKEDVYRNKETNRYCLKFWDIITHYDYYDSKDDVIKAICVRRKYITSMDGNKNE